MKYFRNNRLKIKLKSLFLVISVSFILALLLKPQFFLQTKIVNLILKDLGFELKNIEVQGNYFIQKSEIIKDIKFINCENLFCLDLKNSKENIEKNNWIKSVQLRLTLPSQLKIIIQEEKPYFVYKNNKKMALLNKNGYEIDTLDHINKEYKNLVVLTGEGAIDNISNLLNILALNNTISEKVTEARLIANRRWSLKYLNNTIIELPENNPEKAFYKVAELDRKYGLLLNKLKKIDLRVNDRMIIQLETLVLPEKDNNI
ncbi:FtsQ-type POTRA domain-containing protein [Alphaproteobacteria bacterium]|nr:FtsQ-type POTRA domain-containing protein [Alphaproteobacteria bacterium]